MRRLQAAKELLARSRLGEAVRYLGAIAEAPEDFFIQSAPGEPYRSLKAEAHRLIGRLPPKGRESYELQYGARARRMLQEAVAEGNPTGLAEISRRFFHTQAGYEATFLLGLDNFERGSPLTGALTLRRLRDVGPAADRFEPALSLAMASCWLQAGQLDQVRKALVELKAARPLQAVTVAGQKVRLFEDAEDPVAWLRALVGPFSNTVAEQVADGWLMHGGTPGRNGLSPGGAPLLNTRWRVPITNDPLVENDLQQLRQRYRDENVSEAPVLSPLAVGNVVLMRSVRNLLAVDFDTGKRLWDVPVDDHLEAQLDASANDWMSQQSVQLPVGLAQRIWDDAAYGRLSSDGQRVFSVEDLGVAAGMYLGRTVFIRGRRLRDPGEPKPFNRLAAHDIRTGKLQWHLGGPSDQFGLRLPETFFLGPPLPLAGRLYVLSESKEEIRLHALQAETGDSLWSQQLAVVEQPIQRDVVRRLAGASPSYADGILVCPTSAGAVVAVELATRSLLWGYRYAREADPNGQFRDPVMRRLGMIRGGEPTDAWTDSGATLAGGRVLVSPVEANEIHCLSLIDGRLLWKRPRQDDLYLACVEQGKVILVGRRQVRALRLSDGEEAWKPVGLPEAAVPSGRGYLTGRTYYVPLGSGEVLAVDVAQGRAVRTIKSREGAVPGNLICHRGQVISQSVDGVQSFYQLDALRALVDQRLAAQPDDAEALALRGEILSDEGRREAAIEALRRSYRLSADPRTRDVLREAFLEGLRDEFGVHCCDAEEIERLLDDPQQESTYQRLMAAGFQQAGKWDEALERYGRLIDVDPDGTRLEPISRSLLVRRDRWMQMQLQSLRDAMPAEVRPKLDAFVSQRWRKARQAGTAEATRRFLDYFGSQPEGAEARAQLVDQLVENRRLLEAELLLYRDMQGADRARAAGAVGRMASLLRESQKTRDAAVLYARLAGPLADAVGPDKRTGRQVVEALPQDDPVRQAMVQSSAWPQGKVEVRRASAVRQHVNTYGKFALKYRGGEGPFLEGTSLQFDQGRAAILCRDALGNVRWQVSLGDAGQRPVTGNPQTTSAKVLGHLMILSLDGRVVALDTLSATPRVLWSEELTERPAASRSASRPRPQIAGRFGFNAFQAVTARPNVMPLGPVNDAYVCFQRFRDCVAVDPSDGRTLWVRRDVPAGSELFGDERYVFVVPPGQSEALVLNATDGSLAQRRTVPAAELWLATIGRDILLARREGGLVLERYDPWTRRTVWKSRTFAFDARMSGAGSDPFAPGVRLSIGDDESVAVVEPGAKDGQGRFTLVSAVSGRVLIDAKIAAERSLADCYLLPERDRYLLVLTRPPSAGAEPVPTQPMPGMPYKPIANGLVYCFDRQGQSLWPAPVPIENQHMLVDQPAELPVLVFACLTYRRAVNDGGQFSTALLAIDKRSGRVVARETYSGSTGTFELVGDVEKKTLEMRLQQSTIRFQFTDEPYTAADDVKASQSKPASESSGRSLLEALWRAATEKMSPKKP